MKQCILFTQLDDLISQALAVSLLKAGHRIIGVVSDSEEQGDLQALFKGHLDDLSQLSLVIGSARNLDDIQPLLRHCDALINIMSIMPINESDRLFEWMKTRYHDALLWLEIAEKNHIRKIIFGKSILSLRYRKDPKQSYLHDGQTDMVPDWSSLPPLSTKLVSLDQAVWHYVNTHQMANDFICCYIGEVLGHCKGFSNTPLTTTIRGMLRGKYHFMPNFYFPVIDIQDVVMAFSKALTSDLYNNNRLILAGESASMADFKKIILQINPNEAKKLPSFLLPRFFIPMVKQLKPDLVYYFEEIGDNIIANSTFTRQLLNMDFIDFETSATSLIKDILN